MVSKVIGFMLTPHISLYGIRKYKNYAIKKKGVTGGHSLPLSQADKDSRVLLPGMRVKWQGRLMVGGNIHF